MKIAFAGGGTLGSVTPLIAVERKLKRRHPEAEFVWMGTPNGPERALALAEGMIFHPIPIAKLPRYPSVRWLTFPFDFLRAGNASHRVIAAEKPDVVVSAGGFTAVPVIKAARRAGIPCVIHQLDLIPGLANCRVASLCQSVTTSFAYTKPPFPGVTSTQIPTPVVISPDDLPDRAEVLRSFGLDPTKLCVFVVGGGTGARVLNEAIASELSAWLSKTQIIHSTGGRGSISPAGGYHVAERFDIEGMRRAYAAADLIVSRAGLGAISELAAFSKPCILVPIPNSPQEANAHCVAQRAGAISVKQNQQDFGRVLRETAFDLLADDSRRFELGKKLHETLPTDDGGELAKIILDLIKQFPPFKGEIQRGSSCGAPNRLRS